MIRSVRMIRMIHLISFFVLPVRFDEKICDKNSKEPFIVVLINNLKHNIFLYQKALSFHDGLNCTLITITDSYCSIQEGVLELGDLTLIENCFIVASNAP